jgi:hypothetical protein
MRVDPRGPLTVLAGVLFVVGVRLLELPGPLRPWVTGAFLLLCPGAALVGPVGWSRLTWWTAVLSSSIAISILVSTAMLYAGVWSPDAVLAVLAVGSVAGCAARTASASRRSAQS